MEAVFDSGANEPAPGEQTASALKRLASDLDVAVLAAYRLPRLDSEDDEAETSSTRAIPPDPMSGIDEEFKTAADMIALIDLAFAGHREIVDARITVTKDAHGGTGSIPMRLEREYARFTERPVRILPA